MDSNAHISSRNTAGLCSVPHLPSGPKIPDQVLLPRGGKKNPSMCKCVCEWVWERKRKNLSSTSMKGQFITVCCGRQNILPQCFAGPVDCLNEEWERISTRAASAQPRLAPNHHSPQYRPGSEVKSGAATEARGPLYVVSSPAVADWYIIISACSSTTLNSLRAVLKKLWVFSERASDKV